MAFIPRPRPAPIGFNLTPMIDVTFQLLIFFVCANTWSHAESAERLNLPAPIASGREETGAERPRFAINIRADGMQVVMGKIETRERIIEQLQVERRKHGDRLDVLIRADAKVPFARTREVFDACARAGIRQVRFAVLRTAE